MTERMTDAEFELRLAAAKSNGEAMGIMHHEARRARAAEERYRKALERMIEKDIACMCPSIEIAHETLAESQP